MQLTTGEHVVADSSGNNKGARCSRGETLMGIPTRDTWDSHGIGIV